MHIFVHCNEGLGRSLPTFDSDAEGGQEGTRFFESFDHFAGLDTVAVGH